MKLKRKMILKIDAENDEGNWDGWRNTCCIFTLAFSCVVRKM